MTHSKQLGDARQSALASVVIPAHNEGSVIVRTLSSLLAGTSPGEFEVIVAVNGTTDNTAALARAVSPEIRVVEISAASKSAALNAGDAVATAFPRIYLDADVTINAAALRVLATTLTVEEPLVASPRMVINVDDASWAVRSFYRVWELTDYRQHTHVGSGIYALSRAGRQRFGEFPEIIADDSYVQRLFAPGERWSAGEHTFSVRAPTTLRSLIHRAARAAAGNFQLKSYLQQTGEMNPLATEGAGSSARNLVRRVARTPRVWMDFPVYCVGYLTPQYLGRRKLRRGQMNVWERDESSRISAPQ